MNYEKVNIRIRLIEMNIKVLKEMLLVGDIHPKDYAIQLHKFRDELKELKEITNKVGF